MPPFVLALAMFCLMASAAGLMFWQTSAARDAAARQRFLQDAEHTVALLDREVASRLSLVAHLAAAVRADVLGSASDFVAMATDLEQRFPGFVALNLLDPQRMIVAVAPRERNSAALGRRVGQTQEVIDLLEEARQTMSPRATRLVSLFQGGSGVATYYPIERNGTFSGYVNGVLAVATILEEVQRGVRHKVVVDLSEEDDAAPADEAQTYRRKITVLNREWTVSVRYATQTAQSWDSRDIWELAVAIAFPTVAAGFLLLALIRRRQALDAAQRVAAFAEISSDLLWETDRDLRFTMFAGRLVDLFGLRPGRVIGLRLHEAMSKPVDPESWRRHLELLESKQSFRDRVLGFVRGDGTVQHVRVSGEPWWDAGGKFRGYRGTATDVTAEVSARAEAREAHERLEQAVALMPASFQLFDSQERLVLANNAPSPTADQARPPAGAKLADTVRAALRRHHPDVSELEAAVETHLTALRAASGDLEFETLPGRWVRSLHRRASNGDLVWIRIDVTAQRNAVKELEASQALLVESQRLGKLGYILSDLVQDRVYWSDSLFELRGVPKRAHFTRAEATAFLHPDDRGGHLEQIEAGIRGRRGFESEVRILHPDGSVGWELAVGRPQFDAKGSLTGLFLVVQDITERKLSEQRIAELNLARDASLDQLRDITDNLPVAITYADVERRLRFANKTTEQWFARPVAELLGHRLSDLVEADYGAGLAHAGTRALAGQRAQVDTVATYPDGVRRSIAIDFVPSFATDGSVRGYYALATDTTERKATEDQLRQSQRLEAIGQLTGGVAHDFNNLLAVVSGNLELIEEAIPEELGLHAKMQAALRAARRGGALTRSLLAFARQQSLEPTAVDVNALLIETTDLLRHTLPESIDIVVPAAADLWHCQTDTGQLQNALLNLAINARDAMPDGGQLTIERSNLRLDAANAPAHPDCAPGDYVTITVADTGTGMPPHVVDRAFEPFFTTKSVGEGTGLGLSMVYGFAKQCGGHARLDSEVGRGSAVTLYLPRARTLPHEAASSGSELPGHGETILVVEDDPDVRTLAIAMLDSLGYRVLDARTAKDALCLLGTTPDIHLLLSDVILPDGMNGPELADVAVQRRPGLRVMFMSGYTDNALLQRGHIPPGTPLLQKPFRKSDLEAVLRVALQVPASLPDAGKAAA